MPGGGTAQGRHRDGVLSACERSLGPRVKLDRAAAGTLAGMLKAVVPPPSSAEQASESTGETSAAAYPPLTDKREGRQTVWLGLVRSLNA
jgi:hypothetical protein